MWADITEAAIATGDAKRPGAPLLTFPEFTERLLRLYKVPRDKDIKIVIQNLTNQANNSLSTLFKEWQIDTLNEVQMRQIMLAVDSVPESTNRLRLRSATRRTPANAYGQATHSNSVLG